MDSRTAIPPEYMGNMSTIGFVPGIVDFGLDPNINIYEMDNVYFSTENYFLDEEGFYEIFRECHPRLWKEAFLDTQPDQYTDIPVLDSVICIGHQHSSDFGHWFLEVFPGLLVLPDELLYNSYIAVPQLTQFICDHLHSIGFPLDKIVYGTHPYFAKRFYTLPYGYCGDLLGPTIINMDIKLRKLFKLSDVKPTKYILLSRVNKSRDIGNLDQLLAECKKMWPNAAWSIIEPPDHIKEAAVLFNEVIFVFSIHSSALGNTLFMKAKTVVVELQMEKWLLSFIYLSFFGGKTHFVTWDRSISYRKVQKCYIDIEKTMNVINTAIIAGDIYMK